MLNLYKFKYKSLRIKSLKDNKLIGRFSALACSDVVYITSYYEGIAYLYLMAKSNNEVVINEVSQTETTEHNGVKVEINGIKNIRPYLEGLTKVYLFPNIYVQCGFYSSEVNTLNTVTIKEYTNYVVPNSKGFGTHILLGHVLYPIDTSVVRNNKVFTAGGSNLNLSLMVFFSSNPILKFKVGELDVTPNREALLYSEKTKNALNSRLEAAYEEIYQRVEKLFPEELSVEEALDYKHHCGYNWRDNAIIRIHDYSGIDLRSLLPTKFFIERIAKDSLFKTTYTNYSNQYDAFDYFGYKTYGDSVYRAFIGDKVYTKRIERKLKYQGRYIYSKYYKKIILNNDFRITPTVQKFLAVHYPNTIVLKHLNKGAFVSTNDRGVVTDKANWEFIYDEFYSKIPVVDLETDQRFIDFKKELKEERSALPKVAKENLIVHAIRGTNNLYFRDTTDLLNYFKKLKFGAIICTQEEVTDELKHIALVLDTDIYWARKSVAEFLIAELVNPNKFKYLYSPLSFLKSNKVRRAMTYANIVNFAKIPGRYSTLGTICSFLPEYKQILAFFDKGKKLRADRLQYLSKDYIKTFKGDPTIVEEYNNIMNKLNKIAERLEPLVDVYNLATSADSFREFCLYKLVPTVLYKSKTARITHSMYIKCKHNPIINLLLK